MAKTMAKFYPAGAVTCSDDGVATRLRQFRNYGQRNRYEHVEKRA